MAYKVGALDYNYKIFKGILKIKISYWGGSWISNLFLMCILEKPSVNGAGKFTHSVTYSLLPQKKIIIARDRVWDWCFLLLKR